MGDDRFALFGIIPSAARAVGSVIEGTKMLGVGEKKGAKVGTKHVYVMNSQDFWAWCKTRNHFLSAHHGVRQLWPLPSPVAVARRHQECLGSIRRGDEW